jgi:hypothetical protein
VHPAAAAAAVAAGVEQTDGDVGDASPVEQWVVTAKVANRGTGNFAVELAAVRGERFPRAAAAAGAVGAAPDVPPAPPASGGSASEVRSYREARTSMLLQPGEEREVTLRCDFEPQQLIFDPDVVVLQLHRKSALYRF